MSDTKYYLSKENAKTLIDGVKRNFAPISHTHTKNDIKDLAFDSSLSSSSINAVQNKTITSALNLKVSTNITINGKSLTSNISLDAEDVGDDVWNELYCRSFFKDIGNYKPAEYNIFNIGCKKCGSSLSKDFLRGDSCPLCRADLRSKTTLDRISAYQKRLEDIQKKIESEKKKQWEKASLKWMVRFEYHE